MHIGRLHPMKPYRYAILAVVLAGCNLFTSLEPAPDAGAPGDATATDLAEDASGSSDVPDTAKADDARRDVSSDGDTKIPTNCGDGNLDDDEECDQGGENSDAPNATCRRDCRPRRCGDGIADTSSGELCDDGNLRSHDGCSSQCLAEFPAWTRLAHPLERRSASVAYDTDRDVVVMFGGRTTDSVYYADTWEFDGTTWTQKMPSTSPSARFDSPMVYDTARKRMMIFGGEHGDRDDETWTWDGTDWTRLAPATSPPPTDDHAMVWVEATQEAVLFGGETGSGRSAAVWRFDGTNWREAAVAGAMPAPRRESAMAAIGTTLLLHGGSLQDRTVATDTWAFNLVNERWTERSATGPAREEHVMGLVGGNAYIFGGADGSPRSTMHVWDGTTWSTVNQPAFAPAPRRDITVAQALDRFYVVGGFRDPSLYADVWSWDGSIWTLDYSAHPTSRDDAAYAFDPARGVVIYGGDDDDDELLFDLWTLGSSASSWERIDVTPTPGIEKPGIAFDPVRDMLVHFGGRIASPVVDQTWSFDGAWVRRPDADPRPSPRTHVWMDFSHVRDEVMVVGGCDFIVPLSDIWSYDGTRWQVIMAQEPPIPCESNVGIDPWAERVLALTLGGGSSRTHWFDGSTWSEPTLPVMPPAREEGRIAYLPDADRFVLFAGRTPTGGSQFADTWEWDGVRWQEISTPTAPQGRNGHAMTYDPIRRAIVMTGGHVGNAKPVDTWFYRYDSATPDELCDGAGFDEDGDGVVDCADPDCGLHPDCP